MSNITEMHRIPDSTPLDSGSLAPDEACHLSQQCEKAAEACDTGEGNSQHGSGSSSQIRRHNESNTESKEGNPKEATASINDENSSSDEEDMLCLICRELLKEPIVTLCGHTFCHPCIQSHFTNSKACPLCRTLLAANQIFPSIRLNKIVQQYREKLSKSAIRRKLRLRERLLSLPEREEALKMLISDLSANEAQSMIGRVMANKQEEDACLSLYKNLIMERFLMRLKTPREKLIAKIQREIEMIERDLTAVREKQFRLEETLERRSSIAALDSLGANSKNGPQGIKRSLEAYLDLDEADSCNPRTKRLLERFDAHEQQYMHHMQPTTNTVRTLHDRVGLYTESLYNAVSRASLKVLDTISDAEDRSGSAPIISSISFDRDDEYFATGGTPGKIKIYDFKQLNQDIPEDPVDKLIWQSDRKKSCRGRSKHNVVLHYPFMTLDVGDKISSLCWNSYFKPLLVSADYGSNLKLWDINTGQCLQVSTEHTKRCWSVDFSRSNPTGFASASDDCTVKLWSTTSPRSTTTFMLRANGCSVKFAPNTANYVAVGTADHAMTCWDLRKPTAPLHVFDQHKQTVSYVQWLNDSDLITASTDSTLKKWSLEEPKWSLTYKGHTNVRNFVGLSVDQKWIACGSENNHVYVYHADGTTPVASFGFPTSEERYSRTSPYVSSVCWKRNSEILLAANRDGTVHSLKLQSLV